MSENEAKLCQALSTAVWWLREIANDLPNERRAQVNLAAGDGTKVINAALDGNPMPEWLSPITERKEAEGKGR